MSEEKISHDTCVFATNEENKIIFFKSYIYFKQQDEAQADLKYAQSLSKEKNGAWYISSLSDAMWNLENNRIDEDEQQEKYSFDTPNAKP